VAFAVLAVRAKGSGFVHCVCQAAEDEKAFVETVRACTAEELASVTTLDFDGRKCLTDACLAPLAQHCTQLRLLGVSYTAVTDASIGLLAQHCPELRLLNVFGTKVTEACYKRALRK